MNKKWDYSIPSVEIWKECLRVLKPGGHMLVACGTRTQHRMVCNIEDAGFEVRDIISWVYGSGFPKSLNVGKGVDKKLGNKREVLGKTNSKRTPGNCYGDRPCLNDTNYNPGDITKGSTEYEGIGTGLKPAQEFFTLVRKPLSEKTIVENVMKWGTGGINIDKCRIPFQNENDKESSKPGSYKNGIKVETLNQGSKTDMKSIPVHNETGRFPSNFIYTDDQEVMNIFEKEKVSKSSCGKNKIAVRKNITSLNMKNVEPFNYNDIGNPSRFFYCAKVSTKERNLGLDSFEEQLIKNFRHSSKDENGDIYRVDNNGNKTTKIELMKSKNTHPTIKPVNLMSYLCNLITPENGIILDPFMGSGSTGIAALLNNYSFIGIEMNEEYIKISEERIKNFELYRQFLKK